MSRTRAERGAVTAELAMGIPLLVAVTLALAWCLSLGAAQVRVVDAARESARAVARGDEPAEAVAVGQRVAGDGSRVGVVSDGSTVTAEASVTVRGLGGWFSVLPDVTLSAEAHALAEEAEDTS